MNSDFDIICFSHLRWAFVFQRPQHLLSRYARERRVFYVEEPVATDGEDHVELYTSAQGVRVVVPCLNDATVDRDSAQAALLRGLFEREGVARYVFWFTRRWPCRWRVS